MYPGPAKEIGRFPVKFKDIPASLICFHWQGDTFDLPTGAAVLASTIAVPNQAFVYNEKVLGLQFHPEATAETVEQMITHGKHELVRDAFIQTEEEIRANTSYTAACNDYLCNMLDELAGFKSAIYNVPGLGNSAPLHWQSAWESELCAIRIEQLDWEQPVCSEWISAINETLAPLDTQQILLTAHSLGCCAAIK